ncbi:hypothetical protein E2C01_097909 [Portunus trituberculatus]|uniref:Uncharacterized protein n=1 Tax=Portunus trituberculatus TaxID=210409 RepID=A0A5B7JWE6_PORTR|nr:hypothetical protein [Portunus trituberculatus]
MGLISEVR